jgi:oxygen-independent coproporphyrinogen-3 oxidase
MAGIYIHIPFCKQACLYCNFHFSTSLEYGQRMIQAILKEMEMRKQECTEEIETIYVGGGTPSLLELEQIDALLNQLYKHYTIAPTAEITLEANPDDIHPQRAKEWKSMGVNRFSIGVQSFSDQHLHWMNRAHNAAQSLTCIDLIRAVGFENFSIDLIYGTPGQSLKEWEQDLERTIELQIPHLSCYALTVEDDTPLFHLIQKGKKEKVSSDLQSEQFNMLVSLTKAAGYHHYEISNFAKPGMESKHNSSYWKSKPYLGFGPSAHSYNPPERSWNVSHNMNYMQSIENNLLPSEKEIVSERDRLNEYIMTNLRLSSGIHAKHILEHWGSDELLRIEHTLRTHLEQGKVEIIENGWRLTDLGKFFADGIASALFKI